MGDPYRTGGGPPCPRCKHPLLDEAGELRCNEGCGTWLPNARVARWIDPATLVRSRANPFRATPLPPIACLVCRAPLDDLYQGQRDPITFGQCAEHGVWLERIDRARFLQAFGISQPRPEPPPAPPLPLHDDPVVVDLLHRVRALEAELAALKRRIK